MSIRGKAVKRVIPLLIVLLLLAAPLALRPKGEAPAKRHLVIITPHGEQIRYEFGRAFSIWAREHRGVEVDVDWRAPGGTSDILKFLEGQYANEVRRAFPSLHPRALAAFMQDKAPDPAPGDPADLAEQHRQVRAWFLGREVGIGHDIFFGGGEAPYRGIAAKGFLVDAGLLTNHPAWFGGEVIPSNLSGEIMFDSRGRYYGACLSLFGICSSADRLATLGLPVPGAWQDLGQPVYRGGIVFADPTKSGVVVTVLERIFQQEMARALSNGAADPREAGWEEGWALIRRLTGNARMIADGASQATRNIARGDGIAGFAIDFHARSEANYTAIETSGKPRLLFREPPGGTSVSADPIGLLRGAPEKALAIDFIAFVLSPEGQRLWNYRIGEQGGPVRYALRRLPIRRDLYTPDHRVHMSDPEADPHGVAKSFVYRREWTGPIYGLISPMTKSLCLDNLDECRAAWEAICRAGGPAKVPRAARAFYWMPIAYRDAKDAMARLASADRLEVMRGHAVAAREKYREAAALAREGL